MATQTTNLNREISITKIYNAPRELVFDVFTQPEHVKHWWGPNGFTNTIFKMDVRAGGEWEFIMHGPDGTDYKNKSIFRVIDRPNKLVFDHVSGPKFQTTVLFKAQPGNKTQIEFTMLFETQEQRDQTVKTFGAVEGLKQTLERLEDYLPKAEGQFVIERTYAASIDKVWHAITDRDAMEKWYFNLKEFRLAIGFEFRFMGGSDEKQYEHVCVITEAIPKKKLTYSWRYEGYDGLSHVSFELFPEGNNTKLRLTHTGLNTFPAFNPDFAAKNFAAGWTEITGSMLKEFVEKN